MSVNSSISDRSYISYRDVIWKMFTSVALEIVHTYFLRMLLRVAGCHIPQGVWSGRGNGKGGIVVSHPKCDQIGVKCSSHKAQRGISIKQMH